MATQDPNQALAEVRKVSLDLRRMSAKLESTRDPNTAGWLERLARRLGIAEASLDQHINIGDDNEPPAKEAREA